MKQHNYLRSRMTLMGITSGELAKRIGIAPSSFSLRLCGKGVWTLKEAYTIMRILGISDNEMALAFPDYYTQEGEHGEVDFSNSGISVPARQCRRVGSGSHNVRPIRRTGEYRFNPGRASRA